MCVCRSVHEIYQRRRRRFATFFPAIRRGRAQWIAITPCNRVRMRVQMYDARVRVYLCVCVRESVQERPMSRFDVIEIIEPIVQ